MIESAVHWATSVASLVGVWLNIRLHVAAFWIWACTNSVWVYADLRHDLLPQAAARTREGRSQASEGRTYSAPSLVRGRLRRLLGCRARLSARA